MPLSRKQKEAIRGAHPARSIEELAAEHGVNEELVREFVADLDAASEAERSPAEGEREPTGEAGEQPTASSPLGRHLRALAILALLSFAGFANSLGNSFHFDDLHHIAENPAIKSLDNLDNFFTDPSLFSFKREGRMYRPVLMSSHGLTYAVFGLQPAGFRLVNLGLHILCAFWVYLLLIPPGRESDGATRGLALAMAGVFAVHPIQTETINYLSNRSSLLAMAFILPALLLWRRGRATQPPIPRGVLWVVLAAVLTLLGLLSKEIAIALPLLAFWYEFSAAKRDRQPAERPINLLLLFVPLLAVVGIYLILRQTILGDMVGETAPRTIWSNLLTQTKALALYLRLFLVPVGLNAGHTIAEARSLLDPAVLVSTLLLLGFGGAGLYLARRRSPAAALAAFGIGWFFIALAPTSAVPLNVIAAENRVYAAMPGLVMVLGAGLQALAGIEVLPMRTLTRIAWVTIILVLLPLTVMRNRVWTDELTLWSDVAAKSPDNSRAWLGLGKAHKQRADASVDEEQRDRLYAQALEEYERARELDPNNLDILNNIANVAKRRGEYEKAIEIYTAILSQAPQNANALNNLASVYGEQGRYGEAEPLLKRILENAPDYWPAYINLATLYEKTDRRLEAVRMYDKLLRYNPDRPEAQAAQLIAVRLLREAGEVEEAGKRLSTLVGGQRLPIGDPAVQKEVWALADTHARAGAWREALEWRLMLERGIGVNWGNDLQIGQLLLRIGESAEAAKYLRRAKQNVPADQAELAVKIEAMIQSIQQGDQP